ETRGAGSLALGSKSISRIATGMSPWRRPATWTLRDEGKEPVVTSRAVTFGSTALALRAVDRGAESGIVVSVAKTRISRCGGGIRPAIRSMGVPIPTPVRPGSGSKGLRASHCARISASQPLPGAPLGSGDYPQSAGAASSAGRGGAKRVRAGRATGKTVDCRHEQEEPRYPLAFGSGLGSDILRRFLQGDRRRHRRGDRKTLALPPRHIHSRSW